MAKARDIVEEESPKEFLRRQAQLNPFTFLVWKAMSVHLTHRSIRDEVHEWLENNASGDTDRAYSPFEVEVDALADELEAEADPDIGGLSERAKIAVAQIIKRGRRQKAQIIYFE